MRPAATTTLQARTVTRIATIDAAAWDALVPGDNPFLCHAFLDALEASKSVSDQTGWQPFHLVVEDGGRLVAAAPLYVKSHSYGEYVFDHGWAEGYRRAGGSYYPKLLAAVPFTPVPGPRLLAVDPEARAALIQSLVAVTRQLQLSSLHVNFCTPDEAAALAEAGFLARRGIQFHWENQGFESFDGWLDSLKSSKRKMVRKEREQVRAAGVTIEAVHGDAVDGRVLDEFFPFYLATVDKRWGNAYLSRDFFRRLGRPGLRERVVLMVARHEGRMVGAALNLRGGGHALWSPVGLPGGVQVPALRGLLLSGDRVRHPPRPAAGRGGRAGRAQAAPWLRAGLDPQRAPDPRSGLWRRRGAVPGQRDARCRKRRWPRCWPCCRIVTLAETSSRCVSLAACAHHQIC